MALRTSIRSAGRWLGAGVGFAAAAYATTVGLTWLRFGRAQQPAGDETDPVLDRFMPAYDIVERHHIRVEAPAAITFTAAREQDLMASSVIRAVFKARALMLRSAPDDEARPRTLIPQMLSLGWVILTEVPNREVVFGAVTKPWEPNPVFRSVPPDAFAAFAEPDYVKIAWTLRADPVVDGGSVFRTETRAVATAAAARDKFRRYWSFASPGIWLIRRMSLGPVKAEAERRTAAFAS